MKRQTKSNIKAHLLCRAFYALLLLAVCAIPLALAQPRGRGNVEQPNVQTPFMRPWILGADYPLAIQVPAVASDGTYVYAGTGFSTGPTNNFYRYDPVAYRWTTLPNVPVAVSLARAVYAANTNSVYVFGGRDVSAVLDTVQIYNIATNTWSMGAPMPGGRSCVNAVYYSVNGKIYVIGGIDNNAFLTNQTWEYDPVANTWDTSRATIPMGMARSGTSIVGQYIYLAGNVGNGTGSSAHYRYDIVGNSWAPMAPVPISIWEAAAAGVGQYTYLIGGSGASGIYYDTTYIYDTVSDTWTSGPHTQVKHGYAQGTVIGNRLLVMSGFDGTSYTKVVETTVAARSTITVTNLNDSGAASLRQALADANDGDTINFSVNGTITLTSGELQINKSVTISGPGANVSAVNGNTASRVFYISPGKTVTISGLTITNGAAPGPNRSGGGIYNDQANLTLTHCTISGNSADQGSGGGIFNYGYPGGAMLTITNSTISGNWAWPGGGIFNDEGTVMINKSTMSGNSDNGYNYGGAIVNVGTLAIANSTLSGNSAAFGGAIYNWQGSTLTLTNDTFSGNFCNNPDWAHGGGIYNEDGTVNVGNTIFKAGPVGENIYHVDAIVGSVTSLGYNLCSDDGGGFLTATGDRINTDPKLGPLQNNGGATLTHLPALDSPAIDGSDPAVGTDQRGPGFVRVVNGRADIGAIEVQTPPVPTPTPTPTPRPHGRH